MEETKIVEFYPTGFLTGTEMKDAGYHKNTYQFRVNGKRFSRTIHRPQTGPDMLMSQSVGEVTYQHHCDLPRDCFTTPIKLREYILEREPAMTSPMLLHDRFLHPNWTWCNVADGLTRHVAKYHSQRKLKAFVVAGEEAYGTVRIIRTPDLWYNGEWRHVPGAESDDLLACDICGDIITERPGDLIASHCQHIFHRKCFFPFIWESCGTVQRCPSCQTELFL